jgi:hypothetical protein
MSDRPVAAETALDPWDGSWEGSQLHRLARTLAATPAQRLAWLEEAIELAWQSGALPRRPAPASEKSPADRREPVGDPPAQSRG